MKKLTVLIAGMTLAGGVQAADLSILDNVNAKMMNMQEMATTQGSYYYYYCCPTQKNWASQLTAVEQSADSANVGYYNIVDAFQGVSAGNSAYQENYN